MFHSKKALELISIQGTKKALVVSNYLNPAKVDLAVERFFMFGLTVVEGVHITHAEVAAKVGIKLVDVSMLLQRGETEAATRLNYDLLTQSVKSLIIDALASAKAA
jgi:predicted metal-dependent TIM-barrel fold hydrolase